MDCPYCSMAQKKGELFCSRHATDMSTLKSGIFFIRSSHMEECAWHTTRLSLNFNMDGDQQYATPERTFRISPNRFLLLNEGQQFKTSLRSDTPNNMLTVAFQVGLADLLCRGHQQSQDHLLDLYTMPVSERFFFEKTHEMDDFLFRSIQSLVMSVDDADMADESLQENIENILTHILFLQGTVRRHAADLKSVRLSTRKEIYKRLHWALEFIHGNFEKNITLERVAEEACLSPFHFKRLFKEAFHQAPYQYIKSLRLAKAKELLRKSHLQVQEVCKTVGWDDPSSFIRMFKKETSLTPHQWMVLKR